MPRKAESPLEGLRRFLPEGTFDSVVPHFQAHRIHLTLTPARASVLGDYRAPTPRYPAHRITVNGTLNRYSFLITLLHEIAHLEAFVFDGPAIRAHGPEWKSRFASLLIPYTGAGVFPPDVEAALQQYVRNPAASTCTDPRLFKALRRYDAKSESGVLVEHLQPGDRFTWRENRVFELLAHQRTRARCKEVRTGKIYLFSGIAEVHKLEQG